MDRLTIVWIEQDKQWLVFLGNDITLEHIPKGRGATVIDAINDFDSKWIGDQGRKLTEEIERQEREHDERKMGDKPDA